MAYVLQKHIDNGLAELQEKTIREVQRETAYKWAGRACAAAMLNLDEGDVHEYAHEALEHAALCEDDRVIKTVRAAFKRCGVRP